MSDLNLFTKWQAESQSRSVDIKISTNYKGEQVVAAFVYDTAVHAGQQVSSVDEIDLLADKEKREREELSRLQKKYGGGV
jgi:hypothetical protein